MKLVPFAALVLAALAWCTPARAQAADPSAITAALRPLCPGAEVRLAVAPADTVQGYCGRVEDGRLLVRWGADEWRVPLAQVEGVWVRRRATGDGGSRGAVYGAIAMAVVGGVIVNSMCESPAGCGARGPLIGAAVGGVFGALAGAGIGGMTDAAAAGWGRRYP
ncbi:MAG TPA: hypothetical protein VF006_08425 [Longimicrobium sp.]